MIRVGLVPHRQCRRRINLTQLILDTKDLKLKEDLIDQDRALGLGKALALDRDLAPAHDSKERLPHNALVAEP